jgi:hypothetical protein
MKTANKILHHVPIHIREPFTRYVSQAQMGATLKKSMPTSIFLQFIDLKGQNTSASPGKAPCSFQNKAHLLEHESRDRQKARMCQMCSLTESNLELAS